MASRPTILLPFTTLALLIFALPASAQFQGPRTQAPSRSAGAPAAQGHMGRGHGTAPPFVPATDGFGHRGRHRLTNGLFLYPYLFPDYYEPEEQEPEQPPVQQQVIVQPPAPAPEPARPIEPLVLEERDGQWFRVPTGVRVPVSGQETPNQQGNAKRAGARSGPAEAAEPAASLPPAVLVFRDGHREEVGKYMIEGDTLYVSADYWATGSWNRKIRLSQLDIPASLEANAERGTKFNLPRGPNQVVVRF